MSALNTAFLAAVLGLVTLIAGYIAKLKVRNKELEMKDFKNETNQKIEDVKKADSDKSLDQLIAESNEVIPKRIADDK